MADPIHHLVVPIHVDGLLLTKHVDAVAPLADFSRLPHVGRDADGHLVDRNGHVPWLTKSVATEPLAATTTSLEPGVHLHWALPAGLSRARHPWNGDIEDRARLEFPNVPDRWLVVRRLFDVVQRTWLVESDHVWDPTTPPSPSTPGTPVQRLVTWPIVERDAHGEAVAGLPPFRHVGRSRTLEPDAPPTVPGRSLRDHDQRLTAMGHGEPTFAAFYPNCRNVFGLHDDAATDTSGLSYDVWGWHADAREDALAATVLQAERTFVADPDLVDDDGEPVAEVLQRRHWVRGEIERRLGWTWNDPEDAPRHVLCHGRVRRGSFTTPDVPDQRETIRVAMGNTGTEALSAFLGDRIAATHHPDDPAARAADKRRIEEAIEALHLSAGLNRQVVDIGAKLAEARHTKGFTPSPGEQRWIIRARPVHADLADARTAPHPGAAVGPDLADALHRLNDAQRTYDRARRHTEALRWQVWADWYRSTESAIPPDDEVASFASARNDHDIDLLIAGQRLRLAELARAEERAGPVLTTTAPTSPTTLWTTSFPTTDADEAPTTDLGASAATSSAAAALAAALTTTSQAVVDHNLATAAEPHGVVWVLEPAPGPRFWQPNDPVVVLTGPDAIPTDRHGANSVGHPGGHLACDVLALERDRLDPVDPIAFVPLAEPLLDAREQLPGTVVGVRKGDRATRHPFMIEWQVEAAPIRMTGNASSLRMCYDPDFIADTYSLGDADCELTAAPALQTAVTAATTVRGRGHLTAHAHEITTTAIETYLASRLVAWFDAHGVPSAERTVDVLTQRHAEIRAWFAHAAADRRAAIDGGELDRLQTLVPDGAVHGLAVDGQLGEAILRVVDEQDAATLRDHVGLTDELVSTLVARRDAAAGVGSLSVLAEEPGVDAAVFARVLRWAHAGGWFSTPGIGATVVRPAVLVDDLPAHHGIPAGGPIEVALMDLVNTASAQELENDAGLAHNVVVELLLNRPLRSFTELHALPLTGARSFAKLLHYMDRSGRLAVNPDATRVRVADDDVEDQLAPVAVRGVRWTDPILTVLDAWVQLRSRPGVLTHTLSGFTDSLLMRRRGWQLPVADPLGFVEYRAFAELVVAPAVATPESAPILHGGFSPIRSGDLRLTRLRLVDTFGQARDVDVQRVVATAAMQTDRVLGATLPPRLSQPARLSFRWLDAGREHHTAAGPAPELMPHSARTPIHGWIVNDNLTASIEVHDAAGAPVGSIDRTGRWRPPPGPTGGVTSPDDIRDPHLRRVARWIIRRACAPGVGPDVLPVLVATLESALEQITPASDVHDRVHAILLGRPMAVVRARIAVELRDPPAARQDLASLLTELGTGAPVTDGFERVRLPVRIGDHARLDDGVVVYWVEAGNELGDMIAPQEAWTEDAQGRRHRTRPHDLWIAPADDPLTISMLVDPRGLVHATSGVLPTKVLDLPAPSWAKAAAAIEVGFLTAPVLTRADRIDLALPDGVRPSSWSWLERRDSAWTVTPSSVVLDERVLAREFGADAPAVRDALVAAGWVEAGKHDALRILPVERHAKALGDLEHRADAILRVLDRAGRAIGPVATDAAFGPQQLREGWLQLVPPRERSTATTTTATPAAATAPEHGDPE